MARRNKTTPLDAAVSLLALLPWWICIGLAVVSYPVLHALAQPAPVVSVQPGQLSHLMVLSFGHGLAQLGQYLVPFICVIAAIVSVAKRSTRRQLVASVGGDTRAADAVNGMTWKEFELLVGESFRLDGYQVTETGGSGPDGGVDLVLRKDREKFLVQCKQWRAQAVGVQVVRELYGVMAANGAAGGQVVTSGRFTEEATAFASGRNIQLVDGPKLLELIRRGRAATPKAAAPAAKPTLMCPVCGSGMVERRAKKGATAGRSFFGCITYPSCRGTRSL